MRDTIEAGAEAGTKAATEATAEAAIKAAMEAGSEAACFAFTSHQSPITNHYSPPQLTVKRERQRQHRVETRRRIIFPSLKL